MNAEYRSVLEGLGGEQVLISTPDGEADIYRFDPLDATESPPVVMLYPDAGGVRPGIFSMARRLSDIGYIVLTPNLYFRAGDYPPFNPVTVFDDVDEFARLMRLAQSTTRADSMVLTENILSWVNQQGLKQPIGCVGYCMGGGLALTAAGTFPEQVAAAASLHGARLATDEPDSPHLLANKMKAKVYLGVAGIDPHFSEAECEAILTALQSAGVDVDLEIYPAVEHGFAVSDVPQHHHKASEHHWKSLQSLLAAAL